MSLPDLDRRIREAEQALEQLRAVRAFAAAELRRDESGQEGAAPTLHADGWPRAVHEIMSERRGRKVRVSEVAAAVTERHPELEAADPHALVRSTLNRLQSAQGYQKEIVGREAFWWLPDEGEEAYTDEPPFA